jgi:tetratricopeptide (TPR) repeat protein
MTDPSATRSTLAPGSLLAGRFELLDIAGSGAMASVWQATDRATGKRVAVKVLESTQATVAERFEREAETLAGLSHPNVVSYVDRGRLEDGAPFLAMEWLEGEDLADRLERAPLSMLETVELAVGVASGLGAAHGRGVVHRDVKPSNLVLAGGEASSVKVVDFGIARWAARPMTMAGVALGTPGYMAPEQARGDATIDARADVFALGCVLYECLVGKPAFVSEHLMGLLAKVLLEEVAPPSRVVDGIPTALDALVARMLGKDPERRPADGAAVAAELAPIAAELAASTAGARRPMPSERPRALTDDEQRIVCIVVAGEPPRVEGPLPTLRDRDLAEGQALDAVVASYGGRVARLGPGAYAVLVRSLGSVTEHAARAARCALAVRVALGDVPVALATGRALLGGNRPVGEAIERAVDLLTETLPGRVRVDEATAALLDSTFIVSTDDVGHVLHGQREVSVPVRTVSGHTVPFLGRRRELTMIEAAWRACIEEHQGQAVVVVGEAGMGKSRLVYEALRALEEVRSASWTWRARGEPLTTSSALGLVGRMLRAALSLPEGEREETLRRRLSAHVSAVFSGDAAEHVKAFVGELLAIRHESYDARLSAARGNARLMGEQIRVACAALLAAECLSGPTIIVIEDAHWADGASIDLVEETLRRMAARPLLVLASGRPELRERFPTLFAGAPAVELPLGPLRGAPATELVRAASGGELSDDEVGALVARAGGNPFHLEELVRASASAGVGATPATIVATVQMRLEALSPTSRRVLRAASVFGDVFWQGAVAALLGGDEAEADVGTLLDGLAREELVVRDELSRFPSEEQWRFRHALLREAAYGMLTDDDRRLAHRLAGRWLERAGESDPRVVAQQLDSGEAPEEAVPHYVRAARAALDTADYASTLALAARAFALGVHEAQRCALHLMCAEAHHRNGAYSRAVEDARAVLALAGDGTEDWYHAAAWLGRLSQRTRFLPETEELAERIPRAATDPAAMLAMAELAVALVMAGRGEPAEPLLAALGVGGASADPAVAGYVHRALGIAATSLRGDTAGHLHHMRAAVAAFDRAGDRFAAAAQRSNVGFGYAYLGLYDEAVHELRTALEARVGLPDGALVAVKNGLAMVLRERGDAVEALPLARESMAIFRAQGDRRMQAICGVNLAKMCFDLGDVEGAEREIRDAIDTATEGEIAPVRCLGLATLADVLRRTGRLDEALEAATECHDLLLRLDGMQLGEEAARLSYAEALHASGHDTRAREAIATARDRLEEKAAAIPREEWRQSFLRRVRHHARILELANELQA